MGDPLIDSLSAAVAAVPDDDTLRLHLVELLVATGRQDEVIEHCAVLLQRRPGDPRVRELMTSALSAPVEVPDDARAFTAAAEPPATEFTYHEPQGVSVEPEAAPPRFELVTSDLTLADVGGLAAVKKRLELAFLAPLRNPGFRAAYGKSLRGGLILWGPPGCGKTFLARALAGEIGASFIAVGLSDILSMWLGESERGVHDLFEFARANTPVVLFLDELDAVGQKRTTTTPVMRGTVNQLLLEMDSVNSNNEGVFLLGATNMPWDLDPALRRPGRFDRACLVLPPDEPARQAILRQLLQGRPLGRVDLAGLARRTDGYSGADLMLIVETATELAMMDALASGTIRPITDADLQAALQDVQPSIGGWLSAARNVVDFGTDDPMYTDLRQYLKQRRR